MALHMWWGQGTAVGSGLPFCYVSPRCWTQKVIHGSKNLLAEPSTCPFASYSISRSTFIFSLYCIKWKSRDDKLVGKLYKSKGFGPIFLLTLPFQHLMTLTIDNEISWVPCLSYLMMRSHEQWNPSFTHPLCARLSDPGTLLLLSGLLHHLHLHRKQPEKERGKGMA